MSHEAARMIFLLEQGSASVRLEEHKRDAIWIMMGNRRRFKRQDRPPNEEENDSFCIASETKAEFCMLEC